MSDERLLARIAQLEQELKQSSVREKVLGDLLEKKLNEIYTHYHISRTIGSLLDMQEMLREVTGIIKKALPVERLSVYLTDETRKNIVLAFSSGLDTASDTPLKLGEGIPGRIAENGEHVHIHDLSIYYQTFNDFIHHPGEEKRGGSYIGIALKARQATIGVIGIDNSVRQGLSVDDMDFMALLSHQLAAGIEKAQLFYKTQQLSQHDGLTNLYNYRSFREKLQQEITRSDRTKKPLSLMMLDIDHFKRFNDNFGHQAGDEVLKELSAIITSQCRCKTLDACCRYGGEEFAVILPELDIDKALTVAERLRKAVENAVFTFKEQKLKGAVTVSLGVASVSEENGLSPEELLKKADDALYLSKRNGRNRVSYSPVTRKE